MNIPIIQTRIKKWHPLPSRRVNGIGKIVLEIVTSLASKREVVKAGQTALRQWDDMF